MKFLIFQYVLDKLQASKGQWAKVAKGSGVPLRTLEKVARRESRDPGVMTVEKIARYFHDQDVAAESASRKKTGVRNTT